MGRCPCLQAAPPTAALLKLHAGTGFAEVTGSGFVGASDREAEAGHVVVDALRLAVGDLVGFVPDADGAVFADALVEGLPGGKVGGVAGLGVGDEMVEAAPVLGEHNSAPVEGGVGGEKAEGWVGVEFVEHGAHGFGGGKPLVDREQAVDAKADEEDHEGPFNAGSVTAWVEGRHMGGSLYRSHPVFFAEEGEGEPVAKPFGLHSGCVTVFTGAG